MKSNLGSNEASRLLLEEWANLFQVSAAANVLEVGAALHVGDVGALAHADKSWATLLGELESSLPKEWAFAR